MRHLRLLCVFLLVGCSSYTYQLTEPADARREILKDAALVLPFPPLEYRLERVESHVVVFVHNRGQQNVSLNGNKSVIADPSGQSHAVASQLIPPGNFVKLVLPPLPGYREPHGPQFQIGIGTGFRVDAATAVDQPVYLAAYADDDWDWKSGTVRLTLAYTVEGGVPFSHTLAITKEKK